MARGGNVVIDIVANTAPLRGATSAVRKAFSNIGKAALIGLGAATAGFAALGFAMKKVLAESDIQNVAERKLEAVIRATGMAAGFTADQLKDQADALQQVSVFGDDTIITMQALLATFRNVRGDTFKEASKSILDMATIMGTDLKSAAILVGKALQDPVGQMSALARTGITFSETQKKLIRDFVKTGKMAKAQGVILKELNDQFGGAAQAQIESFGGQVRQLTNELSDMFGAIGSQLEPTLGKFVERIKEAIPLMGAGLTNVIKDLSFEFEFLSNKILDVSTAMLDLSKARDFFVGKFAGGLLKALDPFKLLTGRAQEIFKIMADEAEEDLGRRVFETRPQRRDPNTEPNIPDNPFSIGESKGKSKGFKPRFETGEQMFKRIASAAVSRKDPLLALQQKSTGLLADLNKSVKEQTKVMTRGFADIGVPGFVA